MTPDRSANEVEALILKAARGGGLPLGHAEDLAAAARFLDLDQLQTCPCSGAQPDVAAVQTALDAVAAGQGPQTVVAPHALIAALAAAAQAAWQKRLIWTKTATGAVFERVTDAPPDFPPPQGRRVIPPLLAAHLSDMADKTLVPETQASRASGAGSKLTDND